MGKFMIGCVLFAMGSIAHATDLGVQGTTYLVAEIDLRQLIMESATRADVSAIQKKLKESAATFFDRLPAYGLPHATETATHWVDPSIVLTTDIRAPIKAQDGSYSWQVMYPKGTRVNPLETITPPDRMLFFDGTDSDQVDFVKKVLAAHPLDIMPVEVAGNPKTLSDSISRPVYYATTEMLSRFGILETPSLLGVGKGVHAYNLAVTAFAPAYTVPMVGTAWFGIETKKESAK
jgi:conjugal transfer pilus assembly protein TraW